MKNDKKYRRKNFDCECHEQYQENQYISPQISESYALLKYLDAFYLKSQSSSQNPVEHLQCRFFAKKFNLVNQICSSLWFYPGRVDLIVITVFDKLILLFVINSFIQIVKKWRNFKNLACSRPFFNILNEKVNGVFSSVKFRFCKICNLFSKSSKVSIQSQQTLFFCLYC